MGNLSESSIEVEEESGGYQNINTRHSSTTAANSNFPSPLSQYFSNEPSIMSFERRSDNDEEKESNPPKGWSTVASTFCKVPEFATFERFQDLQMKSLLFYQADLCRLRKALAHCEWDDFHDSDETRSSFASEAFELLQGKNPEWRANQEPSKYKQYMILEEIRQVLEKYNAALVSYSQVAALPTPNDHNLRTMQRWLRRFSYNEEDEDTTFRIIGLGTDCWGSLDTEQKGLFRQFLRVVGHLFTEPEKSESAKRLVAINPSREIDGFTRWVKQEFVPWYHNFKRKFTCVMKQAPKHPVSIEGTEKQENGAATAHTKEKRKLGPYVAFILWRTIRGVFSFPPLRPIKDRLTLPEATDDDLLVTYRESRILQFTSSVATLVACLLPTAAITILSTIHTMNVMLGVIAALTATFAAGLMFMTNAGTSRVEIFTATAAFSAVLVVFVQNQLEIRP